MAKSTRTHLRDEGIHIAIDSLRFSEGINRKVWKILKQAEQEISGEVAKIDPSGVEKLTHRQGRMLKLQDKIGAVLAEKYKTIMKTSGGDLADFAGYVSRRTVANLNQAIGVEIADVMMDANELRAIASSSMFKGRILKEWWKDAQQDTRKRLNKGLSDATLTAQTGMVKGDSIGRMTTAVRRAFDTSRSEAEVLVRTSTLQVCNDARLAMYQQNADLIKAVEWCATLDTRTTPICRALDGRRFSLDGQPVGHNMRFPGVPAHFQCRSTTIPVTKSFQELAGEDSNLPTRKKKALETLTPSQRASIDGPVAGSTDYTEWLRGQPANVQRDVLGPKRYEMFQAGKLKSVADLVHQTGRALSIAELEARYALNGERPLADVLMEYEEEIRKRSTEKAYVLDAKTGRVILSKEGTRDYLSVTEREGLMMQGSVVTHNHPIGYSFSEDDILSCITYRMQELRIVTPRNTYSLSIDQARCPHVKTEEILQAVNTEALKHQIDLIDELGDKLLNGTITPLQYERTFFHEVWKRTGRNLKWLKYQAKSA